MIRGFPWARIWFVVSLAGCAFFAWRTVSGTSPPAWIAALAIASTIGSIAAGSFVMGSGLFARPVLGVTRDRAGTRVALTFDDGPHPVYTRSVMELLEAEGHRGTFFVIGKKADEQRELIAEIVRRGHGVANHSYAHAHATPALPVARLVDDFSRAGQVLAEVTGTASKWFRAPMGILSPRVAAAVERTGLELVGWTATARDGTRHATVDGAFARIDRALYPGSILVLHDAAEREDRTPIVLDLLPRVLRAMAERNLRSVPLDDLLG